MVLPYPFVRAIALTANAQGLIGYQKPPALLEGAYPPAESSRDPIEIHYRD
jgi:hypothetical protein